MISVLTSSEVGSWFDPDQVKPKTINLVCVATVH